MDMSEFWIYAGWGASMLFVVVALVFFLGEAVKLRILMFGRQRFGYGVLEIIERNGRRVPHAVKFEREIKVGNYLFKPKYLDKYIFRNEFGMPTIQFNVRSIEPIKINPGNPEEAEIEVDSKHQIKVNEPPESVVTDPKEDLQSHMAFFQAGILKGGGLSGKLEKLLYLCLLASVASAGMVGFLLYHLKVFG